MSKKKSRPARPRALLRAAQRDAQRLFELRAKLALLEPGGSDERPIEVDSASVIELRALTFPCLRCGEGMRVEAHTALSSARGEPLRLVRLVCRACGGLRELYFRIATPALN